MTRFSATYPGPLRAALFLLALTAAHGPVAAQITDFLTGIEADRLLLSESGTVTWKSNCESSPTNRTRISEARLDSVAAPTQLYGPTDCAAGSQARGGLARPSLDYFRVDSNGKVKRGTVILATSPDPGRISPYGRISASSGRLFWTDETGEFYEGGRLFHTSRGGGGAVVTIADYSTTTLASFDVVEAVSDVRVIALLSTGRLVNFTQVTAVPPFWQRTDIATSVSAMNLRNDRLYWTSYSGTTATFWTAPLSDTSVRTNLGTETTLVSQRIRQMATGDGRIFYQLPSGTGGDIRRRNATAVGTPATVGSLAYAVEEMRANDRWVCWLRNRNAIVKMPVGAAAQTRNLTAERPSDAPAGAPFLEIIQAVQNPRNENPLVADKITHVRAYGRIAASTAGETSLAASPPIVLHGARSGIALPGSPLAPSSFPSPPPPLGTSAGARAVVNAGYWFRLPASWVTEGTSTLVSEVNPSRTVSETTYADNVSPAVTATFTQKAPIGLKLIPTVTHFGTIGRYSPAYQECFDQLEVLLATSDLRFEFCRDLLDEEQTVFDHSPFEFRPDDDDWSKVLWGLGWKKVFGSGGQLAEPGGYDHYVSMLPAASKQGVGYTGVAWPGDEVSITVSQSLFFVNAERSELGARKDATTEAQEIAHNYGLRHVDCGDPRPDAVNILNPYPYASDVLSSPAAAYQGFNPLSNRLILGTEAKDYMSYCSPKWSSDHAWKRMFSRVSSGFGPRSRRDRVGAQCLLGGLIDIHEAKAEMRPTFRMLTAEAARAAASLPPVDARYSLRAWQGGVLKTSIPVRTSDPLADAGHTADETLGWMAVPGDLTGVDRLELVDLKKETVSLGEIKGGGAAPSVTVNFPVAGTVISGPVFEIKWDSNDDGASPLAHMVRFSHDGGASWHLLATNYGPQSLAVNTADVPGGAKCRVEVAASDGILSTSAFSGDFTIGNKPPEVVLFFENGRAKICTPLAQATVECGEPLTLHAEMSDLEDGWMSESQLAWTVAGPVTRTGTGRVYRPEGLIPGSYTVTARATDDSGASTSAASTLLVRPPYVEAAASAPVMDGLADDAAYAADRRPKPLRYASGQLAEVRMVHRDGRLFVAASGLVTGAHADHRFAVAFDMNHNGGLPQAPDMLIEVYDHGTVVVSTTNVIDWVPEVDPDDIVAGTSGDASRWAVEIAIPDARFTAWDGRTVRCLLADLDRSAFGDNAVWPPDGNLRNASTWVDLVLGPDPDDPTDSDADGMADSWELRYFGDLKRTALTDADHDGQADSAEFIAGTDPNAMGSVFRATPGLSGGSVSWNSAPGRSYTVWRSTDLAFWEPGITGLGAAGATTSWIDPSPPPGQAFYKVEAHYCR